MLLLPQALLQVGLISLSFVPPGRMGVPVHQSFRFMCLCVSVYVCVSDYLYMFVRV